MQPKYLYKRTLIVTEVTAVARPAEEQSDVNVIFNIVGHVPKEKTLKRIAQRKAPMCDILSIAKISTKRKLFGITPEAFIEGADELDPQTGNIIKRGCSNV